MAYVNVAEWQPDQVADWLKGVDSAISPYSESFLSSKINGLKLLHLQPEDLEKLGVTKIGHQEVILEAVELLKKFHYELDRENLQLLALRLSSLAYSLHHELSLQHKNCVDLPAIVSTKRLADVASVISAVKILVYWLDRPPFNNHAAYIDKKTDLLKLSLEMATSGQRDRFAEKPTENIGVCCKLIAQMADYFVQQGDDSLLVQPGSLDLATLKKRPGDHPGFFVIPSVQGIHHVGEIKCNSAAHQCGKIETGDEIVQINYQTVVGWDVKEVMSSLFDESASEVLLTLKKRPRHGKVFGQIYIRPYRLPCKKQMNCYNTMWQHGLMNPTMPNLLSPAPRIGLVNYNKIGPLRYTKKLPEPTLLRVTPPASPNPSVSSRDSLRSNSSNESEMVGPSSPNSVRLYLPKPRMPAQRRATISGASPITKHAPLNLEQFWHELKLERDWKGSCGADKILEESKSDVANAMNAHYSLSWSARLCDQDCTERMEISPTTPKPSVTFNSQIGESATKKMNTSDPSLVPGFIPLKERIESFNRIMGGSSNVLNASKPKILPKPVIKSKPITLLQKGEVCTQTPPPLNISPKLEDVAPPAVSPRREKGLLDKSHSTPSYDYSVDNNDIDRMVSLMKDLARKPPVIEVNVIKKDPIDDIPKNMDKSDEKIKNESNANSVKREEFICDGNKMTLDDTDAGYLDFSLYDVKEPVGTNTLLDAINCSLIRDLDKDADIVTPQEGVTCNARRQDELASQRLNSIIRRPSSDFDQVASSKNERAKIAKQDISFPLERPPINPSFLPQPKLEIKKPILIPPPEPPPRWMKPVSLPVKPLKANVSTSKNTKFGSHKSPKLGGKKNALLARRRNISVKDLLINDHAGWLYHRARKVARGSMQWIKCWFIIKGTLFYGFNSKDSTKARLMIYLPGFTASPAEEVKSRSYAFKVYHTGTTFYFAAESDDHLAGWVEAFQRVIVNEEEHSIIMSETDGEEECAHSTNEKPDHTPAIKKLSNLISTHFLHFPDHKSDKKFNSLKKSKKNEKDDHQTEGHAASLDRKYLKFLGGKPNAVPVPTAQFRSYRKVTTSESSGSVSASVENIANVEKSNSRVEEKCVPIQNAVAPVSSTSPTRPIEMGDYRLTTLAKVNANNRAAVADSNPSEIGGSTSMNLESLMASRREEERRQLSRPIIGGATSCNTLRIPQCHAPPPPPNTRSHHHASVSNGDASANDTSLHFVSRSEFGNFNSLSSLNDQLRNISPNVISNEFANTHSHLEGSGRLSRSHVAHSRNNLKLLKRTKEYQPPPFDVPNLAGDHSNFAKLCPPSFEMSLDNALATKPKSKQEESTHKFKNFFGASGSHKILSSPRLRRSGSKDGNTRNAAHSSTMRDACIMEEAAVDTITKDNPEVSIPDYPGLDYPPVFEPATFSLSDVSTILRSRALQLCNNEVAPTVESPDRRFPLSGTESAVHARNTRLNTEAIARQNQNINLESGADFYNRNSPGNFNRPSNV